MDREEENMRMEEQQPLADELDALLRQRADRRSELPWLALGIASEIEARERAREWLSRNGSLFSPNGETSRTRRALRGVRHWIADAHDALARPRVWTTIGAAVAGGVIGYLIGTYLPATTQLGTYSLAAVLAASGAVIAGFASQWQYVKEYYS